MKRDRLNNLKYISPLTGKPCKATPEKILRLKKQHQERPEHFKSLLKLWRIANPSYQSEYIKQHPKENASHVRKRNKKHPEKIKAENEARKVKRKEKCEQCGSIIDLEKHHPDYSKPLEVLTLCRKCHIGAHYEN